MGTLFDTLRELLQSGTIRSVLKAAAYTYVAAALATLLNVARWIRFFRF